MILYLMTSASLCVYLRVCLCVSLCLSVSLCVSVCLCMSDTDCVLTAGHDTTLMPLLAVLLTKDNHQWDGKWAPYGALLSLELYSATDNSVKHLFRLVYNGKPLIVNGCGSALCDVNVLLEILSFGQKEIPEACAPLPQPVNSLPEDKNDTVPKFSLLFIPIVLTAIFSSVCSALCTYIYVCRRSKDPRAAANSKYTRIPAVAIAADGNCEL
jgi:hypothetical protein